MTTTLAVVDFLTRISLPLEISGYSRNVELGIVGFETGTSAYEAVYPQTFLTNSVHK